MRSVKQKAEASKVVSPSLSERTDKSQQVLFFKMQNAGLVKTENVRTVMHSRQVVKMEL